MNTFIVKFNLRFDTGAYTRADSIRSELRTFALCWMKLPFFAVIGCEEGIDEVTGRLRQTAFDPAIDEMIIIEVTAHQLRTLGLLEAPKGIGRQGDQQPAESTRRPAEKREKLRTMALKAKAKAPVRRLRTRP